MLFALEFLPFSLLKTTRFHSFCQNEEDEKDNGSGSEKDGGLQLLTPKPLDPRTGTVDDDGFESCDSVGEF